MTRRVGIFGGSFDPPHVGHVLAVAYVLATGPIDEVVVVPCYEHPFAKDLSPFEFRWRMCEQAFSPLTRVELSDVEARLGGESKTLRTLEALQKEHPDWSMRLLIGTDILKDIPRWYAFDRIERIAPPLLIPRTGYPDENGKEPALLPQISSTRIRQLWLTGDRRQLEQWVPRGVLRLLSERAEHVWRAAPGDADE